MDKKKKRNPKSQKVRESKPKQAIEESFDEIFTEDYYGKDFDFLEKQPVSESDNSFLFKYEKEWTTVDANKYEAEFFSLDLKKLERQISELRFDQLVEIEERYFTSDQLTSIENEAQRAKDSNTAKSASTSTESNRKDDAAKEDTSEDLDFLLSLEEPVTVPSTLLKQSTSYGSGGSASRPKRENIDLEKWLDSILDD